MSQTTITYLNYENIGGTVYAAPGATATVDSAIATNLIQGGLAVPQGTVLPGLASKVTQFNNLANFWTAYNSGILAPNSIYQAGNVLVTVNAGVITGSGSYSTLAALQTDAASGNLPQGIYVVGVDNWVWNGSYLSKTSTNIAKNTFLPAYSLAKNAQQKGVSPCNVAIIGDSLTVGQYALGSGAGSYWYSGGTALYSLSRLLAGFYGGTDNAFFGGVQAGDAALADMLTYDSRITQGSGTTWVIYGLATPSIGSTFDYASGGTSATLTFTPATSWDAVDIYYVTNTGYGSVAVTGSVSGTLNSNATLGIGLTTLTKTYGTGTLSLTATNENHIIGLNFYSTTNPSVNFIKMGNGSTTSTNWADNSAVWKTLPALQKVMNNTANPIHLWVIQLGVNDQVYGTSVSTFSTNMQTLITTLKRSNSNLNGGDIALMVPAPCTTYGSMTAATQVAFREAIYALALANPGVVVIDHFNDFISYSYGNSQGWYSSSGLGIHESASGYTEMAKNILNSGVL